MADFGPFPGGKAIARPMQFYVAGNTTGASSSTTGRDLSISAAGIISAGFSSGSLILSATMQTIGGLAAGNTTGSSSSTTFDARSVTVSGAGVVSVGYSSNNILIISATTAASLGGLSFNAVGNTIGLSSSSASSIPETLTLSGAGGISVGFSSSTIVISQNNTSSFFAVGANTAVAGTTTSMVAANSLSFSGKNDIDVAFNAGTIVIANEFVSYFEPIHFLGLSNSASTNSATLTAPIGTMLVGAFVVPNAISFNQFRMLVSRTSGVASLSQNTAAGSITATASAGWNSSVSLVIYSRQGGTSSQSFTSFLTTAMTYGMTQSWSISRTGASNSVTATLSFGWAQGTTAANTTTFTSSATAATTTIYSFAFTAASLFTNGTNAVIRMDIPFTTSLGNGAYLLGIIGSSAAATATGNSLNTAAAGNWSQSLLAVTQGNSMVSTVMLPGVATASTGPNFFPGVGSTSSAGSVPPTTIGWQALSTAISNPQAYVQAGVL